MKRLVSIASLLLILGIAGCGREESTSDSNAGSEPAPAQESAQPAEDTATADDGGGAMAGSGSDVSGAAIRA